MSPVPPRCVCRHALASHQLLPGVACVECSHLDGGCTGYQADPEWMQGAADMNFDKQGGLL